MSEPILPYSKFVRLVLDALDAAKISYMIGGRWQYGHGVSREQHEIWMSLFMYPLSLSNDFQKN